MTKPSDTDVSLPYTDKKYGELPPCKPPWTDGPTKFAMERWLAWELPFAKAAGSFDPDNSPLDDADWERSVAFPWIMEGNKGPLLSMLRAGSAPPEMQNWLADQIEGNKFHGAAKPWSKKLRSPLHRAAEDVIWIKIIWRRHYGKKYRVHEHALTIAARMHQIESTNTIENYLTRSENKWLRDAKK